VIRAHRRHVGGRFREVDREVFHASILAYSNRYSNNWVQSVDRSLDKK
jgi:hypothetical protein